MQLENRFGAQREIGMSGPRNGRGDDEERKRQQGRVGAYASIQRLRRVVWVGETSFLGMMPCTRLAVGSQLSTADQRGAKAGSHCALSAIS